jgi:hypothetical protein
MRPPLMKTAITLLGLLAACAPAHAQAFGPTRSLQPSTPMSGPALSPYLNIVGGGSNPAVNYYNGTRALFTQQQMYNQLTAPQNMNFPTPTPTEDDLFPALPQTGHLAGFQYYTPYFNAPGQRAYFPLNPYGAGQGQGQGALPTRPQR